MKEHQEASKLVWFVKEQICGHSDFFIHNFQVKCFHIQNSLLCDVYWKMK